MNSLFQSRKTLAPITGELQLNGVAVPYAVQRRPSRRRSIGYRVIPGTGVVMAAPLRVTVAECLDVLKRRAAWIVTHFNKPKPAAKTRLCTGATVPYLGEPLTLALAAAAVPLRREGNTLHGPRARLKPLLAAWYRQEAGGYFHARVAHWQAVTGLVGGKVRISTATRRWGSCSHRNTLAFSWRLMMMPPALIDYVIVHELCHVVEKNHGPRFWALVERFMPAYRQQRLLGGQAAFRRP